MTTPHALTPAHAALGGHGHSTASDAAEAGREAVRVALGGRVPAAGDLVVIYPSVSYDL
jgi:hypothetical protein